jgi:hypothetical protein
VLLFNTCKDVHPKRGSVGSVTTTRLEGKPLGACDTTVGVGDSIEILRIARIMRKDCGSVETLFSMN